MFIKHCIALISCGILFSLWSCINVSTHIEGQNIGHYPVLRNDTINEFAVGDTFVWRYSKNSCCTYCFVSRNVLTDTLVQGSNYKSIGFREVLPDKDCDGCATFLEELYLCTEPGLDSILQATIENGYVTDFGTDCNTLILDTASLRNQEITLEHFIRKFIIRVK